MRRGELTGVGVYGAKLTNLCYSYIESSKTEIIVNRLALEVFTFLPYRFFV
jgi:hypothetical protein